MPSLSLRASINYPFIGGPSGPSYDADATAWFSAVESAGASISPSNKTIFNNCILDLKGILPSSTLNPTSLDFWSELRMAGFICGFDDGSGGVGSSYQGCFVPMVGRGSYTATNGGFTASDYNKFNGLTGNGIDKNIQTSITPNNISGLSTQRVLTIATTDFRDLYVNSLDQNKRFLIGSGTPSNQDFGIKRGTSSIINPRFCMSENTGTFPTIQPPVGNRVACYNVFRTTSGAGGTVIAFDYSANGSGGLLQSGSGSITTPMNIFSRGSADSYYDGKIGYYGMAGRMSAFTPQNNHRPYLQIIKLAIDSLT